MARWVLGSVAEKVLQASPVPLALIRPPANSENQADIDASAFGRLGLLPIPTDRTILVPLDVSVLAEEALPQAIELATATGASLLLVPVMPLPDPIHLPLSDRVAGEDANNTEVGSLLPPRQSIAKAFKELYEREEQALTSYLTSVARRVKGAGTLGVEIAVRIRVLEGDVAREILRAGLEEGTDIIVMTTQGRGGLERLWPGSAAMNIVREASLPVLLVHEQVARRPE